MFGLGPTELIVILVLALLVLGPSRIPDVASSLGKAIRSFRRATRELRDQIDIEDEVRRPLEDLRAALRDEPPPTPPPPPIPLAAPLVAPPAEPTLSTAADHDVHPVEPVGHPPVGHPPVGHAAHPAEPAPAVSATPIAGPSGAPTAGPPAHDPVGGDKREPSP